MRTFDIMNHPSRWIYRLVDNENLTILRCVGEYSEIIGDEFNGVSTSGWEIVQNTKVLASVYKYIIQENLDFDHVYMLDI